MDVLTSETFWTWNEKGSDIKLVSLYPTKEKLKLGQKDEEKRILRDATAEGRKVSFNWFITQTMYTRCKKTSYKIVPATNFTT